MIETLSLSNFKSFRELPSLATKPISILCGTNSSGKSSILQSILLLKQTLESQNPNQTLLLNGRFVHLGVFENIVYQKDPNRRVSFDVSCRIKADDIVRSGRGSHSFPITMFLDNLLRFSGGEALDHRGAQYVMKYRVSIGSWIGDGKKSPLRPVVVDELECRIQMLGLDGRQVAEMAVGLTLSPDATYIVKWQNLRNPFVHPAEEKERREAVGSSGTIDGITVEIANLFPMTMSARDSKTKAGREKAVPTEIVWVYRMLNDVFAAILNSYAYIGPLREEPSRRYIYEDEIVEIGIKGENAAYIYLSEQDRQLGDHYFCSGDDKSPFLVRKRPRLATAVNEWLDLMGIHELKPEAANEIIYLNLNASASGRTRVNIADVGFGVSQIFPIVVEGLRMARGHTLLLEQPEIHLHPNLQMQMADYFICLALSGKRVIVETHSDHIVNRLVRRIVEDQTDDLNALIGMYFVRATSEGAIVEEVRIDPNEGIVNWPRDFFDQTAAEQERLIQAGVRRRGQSRGRRHE